MAADSGARELEPETRRVIDALYEAFLAGDSEGMLAQMSDDVEVRFLAQGTFRGLPAVRRFMDFARSLLTDLDFRIRKIVVDGEVGAAIWDETARTATGQPWENHGVDVIRVRGGKIVALHENNDVNLVYRHFPRYVDPKQQPEKRIEDRPS
jgi:ketosteroid isomerase-like protein